MLILNTGLGLVLPVTLHTQTLGVRGRTSRFVLDTGLGGREGRVFFYQGRIRTRQVTPEPVREASLLWGEPALALAWKVELPVM